MGSKKQTGASTRVKVNVLEPKKKLLPPDPEECNDDRAAHIDAAIKTFSNNTSVDRQDVIGDLFASSKTDLPAPTAFITKKLPLMKSI